MIDLLHYEFMRNAILAGLLGGIICGILGCLVVVNRIVFLSGGIAHAAYGGIGLAFYLGWPYLPCTLGFSLAAGLLMEAVMHKARHRADTIIGVVWALGMALGVILLDLTPGYKADLMSYLFGSIMAVPAADVRLLLLTGCFVIFLVSAFYPELLALSYDPDFARIRGVPVTALHFVLISLLAVSIVLIIRIVGLILVIALLTIAPFMIERHVRSIKRMMVGAAAGNVVFTLVGLSLSWALNLTSGAAIIMVAGFAFFLFLLFENLFRLKGDFKQCSNNSG